MNQMNEDAPSALFAGKWARMLPTLFVALVGGGAGGGVTFFTLPMLADRVSKVEERTTMIEKENAVRDLRVSAMEAQAISVRLETFAEISKMRDNQDNQSKALARIEGALGSRTP